MTVHCPHCSTGYLLPDHLVGPKGAAVRCPECRGEFAVWRDGPDPSEPNGARPQDSIPARDDGVADAPAGAPEEPGAVADRVLDSLDQMLGGALRDANRRGKVFAEHGPAILDAFAEYRRQAGHRGTSVCFRHALRDRCGIDLSPRAAE